MKHSLTLKGMGFKGECRRVVSFIDRYGINWKSSSRVGTWNYIWPWLRFASIKLWQEAVDWWYV